MAKPLVPDSLWAIVKPFIPVKKRRKRNPGRKRIPDRAAVVGLGIRIRLD